MRFIKTLFLILLIAQGLRAERLHIVALVSSEIRPYVMALEGMEKGGIHFDRIFYLERDKESFFSYLSSKRCKVVAIGSYALSLTPPERLLFYTMVLNPPRINACGVSLSIDPLDKLKLLKKSFVNLEKVFIYYSSNTTLKALSLRFFSSVIGLKLEIKRVKSKKELLLDIQRIKEKGVFLFLPDPLYDSDVLIKKMVKDLLVKGIGSVGFNRFFLRIGALASFVFDYREVGYFSAGVLKKYLFLGICQRKTPPFRLFINRKIAKRLGLEVRKKLPKEVELTR